MQCSVLGACVTKVIRDRQGCPRKAAQPKLAHEASDTRGKPPDERAVQRKVLSTPLLQDFHNWL